MSDRDLSVGWRSRRNRGPWLYWERGGFMLHAGARRFRDPWDNKFRAWLTLRVAGRYLIFKQVESNPRAGNKAR